MNSEWWFCFSPVIAFICNLVVHVIYARLTLNITLAVFRGLFAGLFLNLVILTFLFDNHGLFTFFTYAFASLLTYLSLSFCYWGFLNLNRTSLRIRILRELLQVRKMSEEQLLNIYSPHELINARMQRLEKAGKLIKRAGKWQVQKEQSRELFILAYLLAALRKLIIPSAYFFKNTATVNAEILEEKIV